MPDLTSVFPATRFATTMGCDLVKVCNPRKIFFWKNYPPKILHLALRESPSFRIRNALGPCCDTTTSVVQPSLGAQSMSKRQVPAERAASTKNKSEMGSEKKHQRAEWPPSEPGEEFLYTNLQVKKLCYSLQMCCNSLNHFAI